MDFSVDTLMAWLEASAGDPWMLGAALALATLATEDGALIAGSLLVGAGITTPLLAITALAFGITAGDIALYGAGWSARSSRFLRRHLPVKKSRGLRRWLKGKETTILFFSRFTPGTRLITYVTFGFLKLSLIRFTIVMTIASVIWVTGMVLFVSEIQKTFSAYGGWVGALAGLAFALGGITILRAYLKKKQLAPTMPTGEGSESRSDIYSGMDQGEDIGAEPERHKVKFEGNNDRSS